MRTAVQSRHTSSSHVFFLTMTLDEIRFDVNAMAEWPQTAHDRADGRDDDGELQRQFDAVVQATSIASCWCYSDKECFTNIMSLYGVGGDIDHIRIANDTILVCVTAYVITISPKVIIVAVRGTEPLNIINWMASMNMERTAFLNRPVYGADAYVHKGFYRNARIIHPLLMRLLHSEKYNKAETVYLTGHSYGGALAVLLGAMMSFESESNSRVKGQPMVGDRDFAEVFKLTKVPLHRFVYRKDAVPHLPPRIGMESVAAMFGAAADDAFCHFGREYHVSKDGRAWVQTDDMSQPISVVFATDFPIYTGAQTAFSWIYNQTMPKYARDFMDKINKSHNMLDHGPDLYSNVLDPNNMR